MLLNVLEKIENILEMIKKPVYLSSVFLLHSAYILVFIGVIQYTPSVINNISIFIQLFVCLFLIIKFNPLRKHELKDFDSTIIFGSALFLLTNLGITEYLKNYFEKNSSLFRSNLQEKIKNILHQ
jgi:hypothetical protein